ncbi:hypothetical protein GKE82_09135 [Conexibacter sp. W3-3-2]|uniref:hypothetical protein n=1 Tax=Solirubrobacterales TaxID=588673 RepID=UPI0012B732DE|nr:MULTISPECIES: hypothetical protein [Solirubrobacterales]MTD44450.1 hypothetical protein [Conexibacter sp. W3-3-2]
MDIARLADSDPSSLATRVARITAGLAGTYVVLEATLWYTGRPPVYTAVVKQN